MSCQYLLFLHNTPCSHGIFQWSVHFRDEEDRDTGNRFNTAAIMKYNIDLPLFMQPKRRKQRPARKSENYFS
jgi:hypothetical protein